MGRGKHTLRHTAKMGTLAAALLLGLAIEGPAQQTSGPEYIGSEACTGCHEEVAELWAGSHHALAWTKPGSDNIIADFNGTEFTHDGTLTRFSFENGDYFVTVTEKDGSTREYPVHSVAGIAPLQQYLLETEPGRLQSFDVVWDAVEERWYHLYPDQDLPPDDGLHWTGPYKTWNARCAECHATGYQRNYGLNTRRYASTQAETGVGCEACHGPGSTHRDWANGLEIGQTGADLDAYGFSMSFGAGDTEAEIQQCAGCHSRREALGNGNPIPGAPYHDAYSLAVLRPGLYHADGQILDEVYVYGSFLQSKMYARGVGCMNCHEAHSAELKADGNAVCTQCHSPTGNPEFPTLKRATYDSPEHHFHEAGTDGAQCKSCHMIERTYMGIDGRRDHSFRIPRPDLGAQTGAPDACTDCHSDRDQAWAAAQIATWYPDPVNRQPNYGQVLARGRENPAMASGDLLALATDTEQAGIVRATALFLLQGNAGKDTADQTAPLLSDPDPLVRAGAVPLQRAAPVDVRMERLMPVLSDPMKSVRIAAARSVIDVPPNQMSRSQTALVDGAMRDWQTSIANKLDFPESHLVMGGMALTQRRFPAAVGAFREVVRLDPQRTDAWSMLVRLNAAVEGRDAARRVLREALAAVPNDPGLRAMQAEIGQ